MHLLDLIALLACALLFAKLLGGFANRFGIPSVLIELLTGVLLGNLSFGDFNLSFSHLENSELVKGLSELGVLFLLFLVGLETNLEDMKKVGWDAAAVAFLGVLAPFVLAFVTIPWIYPSSPFEHTLFIAAALTATSVGITARVLQDCGKLASVSGQIILGAAIIDDVLGIIVLTIVSALITQGHVNGVQFLALLLKIGAFGIGIFLVRKIIFPQVLNKIKILEISGTVTILLLCFCLLSAWAAEKIGLAGIIGAFALGLALDRIHFKGYEQSKELPLEKIIKPITDFLSPIFFILMGMGVKLKSLDDINAIQFSILLIFCALLGKMVCGLAVSKKSKKRGAHSLLIGFGMIPRGEVGLIFAAMGKGIGIIKDSDYTAVVIMVVVTTLLAPFLISWQAKRVPS